MITAPSVFGGTSLRVAFIECTSFPGERVLQEAIARRFWEVGRLTVEHCWCHGFQWDGLHRWPGVKVAEVSHADGNGALRVALSNSATLEIDRVVFATGYRAQLSSVPYLAGLLDHVACADGFPMLDEAFQTSCRGLYIPGSATRADPATKVT